MIGRRRSKARQWDREALEPAIRKSICTGEETFGFVRRADGSFMDICLLRDMDARKEILSEYGIAEDEVRIFY